MRKTVLIICILFCFTGVFAQEAKKPEQPARIEVDQISQLQVALAQKDLEKAQQQVLLQKLLLENMRLQLRLMLKVPDDYEEKLDENGKLVFVKPQTAKEKPKE